MLAGRGRFEPPDGFPILGCLRGASNSRSASGREKLQKLRTDSFHPSLHFKQVKRYWSVRVGLHHRAVAVRRDDDFVWFWIGSHSEYDKLMG